MDVEAEIFSRQRTMFIRQHCIRPQPFWDAAQHRVVDSDRSFAKPYGFHPQRSSGPRRIYAT